jgi:uncharacterized protein (TIGR03437 family)
MRSPVRFCIFVFLFLTPLLSQNGETEFKGRIDSLPASAGVGTWQVAGRAVVVTTSTKLDNGDGPFVAGACVQVKGSVRQDGSVEASEIKTENSSECSAGGQNGGEDGGTDDHGNGNGGNGNSGGNNGNDDGQNEGELEFKGVLGSFPASAGPGEWVVGGRSVTVNAATMLVQDDGAFAAGGCVEVKAQLGAGALPVAVRIETESPEDCGLFGGANEFNFKGLLQAFPAGLGAGVWQIGGRAVVVGEQTVLLTHHGSFVPNACVEAEGALLSDGTLQASKLQTESPDDCGAQQQFRLQDRLRFRDRITAIPGGGGLGNWQVGGRTVEVVAFTRLRTEQGPLVAGACADVKARVGGSGLQAEEIRRERDEKCEDDDNRGELKFFGTVNGLPADGTLLGNWLVDGTTVRVTAATRVEQHRGPVTVGSCVEVEGDAAGDGSVSAREIEAKSSAGGCMNGDMTPGEVEFRGLIQLLPAGGTRGTWQVAGRSVLVTNATELQFTAGGPAVGQCAKVHGALDEDAVVVAREIEAEATASCGVGAVMPEFEVTGALSALPDNPPRVGDWTIGGIAVAVVAATERNAVSGPFVEGACVKAQGAVLASGTRQAREVETRPAAECGAQAGFEFQGLVESAPAPGSAAWTISGIVVGVSAATEIDERLGPLVVGACARVEGTPLPPNRVTARQIHVLNGSGICASTASTVGGATMRAGAVSPGQILSVFGPGVGPARDRDLEVNDDRVARQLGATRVLFDGEPAPLLFLSPQQLNLITPLSLRGKSETEMQIETEGGWSQTIRLRVSSTAPGLFTLNASGQGPAAALNTESDGGFTVNGEANPITSGGVLVLYTTGLGTADRGDDGQLVDPTGQVLPRLDLPVTVTVGGVEARVLYAGGAPGLVVGVWQLNVEVPLNIAAGVVAVRVQVGGETSPEGVTVAVQ